MRVVFDTNIYISAFLFKGGVPSRLLDLARDRQFDLFFSPEILQEIEQVTRTKFDLSLHERDRLIRYLGGAGQIVYPDQAVNLVKQDASDNRILECALASQADYLATGDKKHLLSLKHPFPFHTASPAQFFKILH